jgi:hypothetical protein
MGGIPRFTTIGNIHPVSDGTANQTAQYRSTENAGCVGAQG